MQCVITYRKDQIDILEVSVLVRREDESPTLHDVLSLEDGKTIGWNEVLHMGTASI